jgi:hypothetical protein
MAKARKKVTHPWLAAATICQQLLEEKDNVISIIRMIDVFTLPKPPGWDGKTPGGLPLLGFLAFRAGDAKGTRTVRLFAVSPNGKRKKVHETEVEFLGGNTGINMRLQILFTFKAEGTHWIEVFVDKHLMTRIPISIAFQPAQLSEGATEQETEKTEG